MKNQKIAILGFGVTGQAILNYLLNSSKYKDIELDIEIFDAKKQADISADVLAKIPAGIKFNFEQDEIENVTDFDILMLSPGFSPHSKTVQTALEKNISIYNDTTLFLDHWEHRGPVVGVTGSNGKSTTVSLIYGSLQSANVESILVGNIGKSPLDYLLELENSDKTLNVVMELSSYQLEFFEERHCADVAVITNISPNHLDHHNNSMEEYVGAKLKIAGQQTKLVTVIDDEGIQKYVLPKIKNIDTDFVSISDENYIDSKLADFFDENNRNLKGEHNLYNIAVALCVLKNLNIEISESILDFMKNYNGLEHRIEFVREIDGVKYINDSKSTTPDATRVALETFGEFKNIILIMGGTDKKISFDMLNDYLNQYVKFLIIFNHDINQKMIDLAEKNEIPYQIVNDMNEVVELARQKSSAGDTVLLSPAAASMGKFKNFEDRGQVFKKIVNSVIK